MKLSLLIGFGLILGFLSHESLGQTDSVEIKVGVFPDPPFVIKDVDGSFYGLSIDLWYYLADEMDVTYRFVEYRDQLGLIRALDYSEVDLTVNPMTVNGARLKLFEAAHPFITSEIGVATSQSNLTQFQLFLSNIFSVNFLRLIGLLVGMIMVFGLIMWILEKRRNPNQFKGIIDGFWWSVVTMTTVGYGDKAPQTVVGRFISVLWMFIAIILISSFTATIASTMTINSLEAKLERFEDIQQLGTIGTVNFSNSSFYLKRNGVKVHHSFSDAAEGLDMLASQQIDIFVFDRLVIEYLVKEMNLDGRVKIVPVTAGKEFRSFLFPKGSPLTNQINPLLVDRIKVDAWKKTLSKYHLQPER